MNYQQLLLYIISLLIPFNLAHASIAPALNDFGSRPAGMGGAFIGLAEGPESIFYNWAKTPVYEKQFFKIDYSRIQDIPYISLSAQQIHSAFPFRVGYLYLSEPNIPETVLNSISLPSRTNNTFSLTLHRAYIAYQKRIASLDWGIRGTILHESLHNKTGWGTGLDFATHYHITNTPISIGATIQNALSTGIKWSTNHTDSLNPIGRIGVSSHFLNKKLITNIDIEKEKTQSISKRFGAEYWLSGSSQETPAIAIRGGLKNKDITMGISIINNQVWVEYAYTRPEFSFKEQEHRFSIGKSLHTYQKKAVREPVSFTQIPEQQQLLDTKAVTTDTSPLVIAATQIKISPQSHTLSYWIDAIAKDHQLNINHTKVPIGKQKTTRLPIKLMVYTPDNNIIIIDIETTPENHIVISGHIPNTTQLLINNRIIKPNKNGEIYFKKYETTQTWSTYLNIYQQ